MADPILVLQLAEWFGAVGEAGWVEALEHGRVLYFPRLKFALGREEESLLSPQLLEPGVRNISLDAKGELKGAAGDTAVRGTVAGLLGRFAKHARSLVKGLLPAYDEHLRAAPTSLRPAEVSSRKQSVRADDRRLHVDAFPSRPNRGERILRVFSNVNPHGEARVWRVGEPFEDVARQFVPRAKPYSPWQAHLLHKLGVTKSLRSEYDHLMLQIHDRMKADEHYQHNSPQVRFEFPPGCTWVCFSDQTVHAAMSGQYMMEQTFHLPAARQYNPDASPVAILGRLAGHPVT
jgi:hypothetical protein